MYSIKVLFFISLYQLFNDDVQTLHIPFKLDPDLTWAYFWPAVNKRPTQLWRGYFLIQPKNIFLTRRAKNWEIRDSGENFQTQTKDGWPNPSIKNLTWPNPSQKFLPWPITTSNSFWDWLPPDLALVHTPFQHKVYLTL